VVARLCRVFNPRRRRCACPLATRNWDVKQMMANEQETSMSSTPDAIVNPLDHGRQYRKSRARVLICINAMMACARGVRTSARTAVRGWECSDMVSVVVGRDDGPVSSPSPAVVGRPASSFALSEILQRRTAVCPTSYPGCGGEFLVWPVLGRLRPPGMVSGAAASSQEHCAGCRRGTTVPD
jgi:hypothetical protein